MSKSIRIALLGTNCREALGVQQTRTDDTITLEFRGADGVLARVVLQWTDNALLLEGWTHENIVDADKFPNRDGVLYDADEEAEWDAEQGKATI
jgi:hypothetical protein